MTQVASVHASQSASPGRSGGWIVGGAAILFVVFWQFGEPLAKWAFAFPKELRIPVARWINAFTKWLLNEASFGL